MFWVWKQVSGCRGIYKFGISENFTLIYDMKGSAGNLWCHQGWGELLLESFDRFCVGFFCLLKGLPLNATL